MKGKVHGCPPRGACCEQEENDRLVDGVCQPMTSLSGHLGEKPTCGRSHCTMTGTEKHGKAGGGFGGGWREVVGGPDPAWFALWVTASHESAHLTLSLSLSDYHGFIYWVHLWHAILLFFLTFTTCDIIDPDPRVRGGSPSNLINTISTNSYQNLIMSGFMPIHNSCNLTPPPQLSGLANQSYAWWDPKFCLLPLKRCKPKRKPYES